MSYVGSYAMSVTTGVLHGSNEVLYTRIAINEVDVDSALLAPAPNGSVDLVMLKDISWSIFIFRIGTFIILSSSYMKDINMSYISIISYKGLVYMSVIFLFRSIICKRFMDIENTSYVIGEYE